MRKNKHFYYRTGHFFSISGMIYRMKQNAAGLANICILSTMVLISISTTVSLYAGIQIINGDKPIVYIENDEAFVTTSPWTGKENMSQRLTAKLGGIIVLEQSDSNEIKRLTVHNSAGKVFSQFLFDCNTEQEAKNACRIAEKMLKTPVWLLKNRGDIESAKLCRKILKTYLASSNSH